MRAFFKGWRRKAGGVALAMALAVVAGWMRSLFVYDSFHISAGTMNSFGMESERQSLCFYWVQDSSDTKSDNEFAIPFWRNNKDES